MTRSRAGVKHEKQPMCALFFDSQRSHIPRASRLPPPLAPHVTHGPLEFGSRRTVHATGASPSRGYYRRVKHWAQHSNRKSELVHVATMLSLQRAVELTELSRARAQSKTRETAFGDEGIRERRGQRRSL